MAEAYVTLLYDDGYLPGLLVLGHRLRDLGTRRKLVTIVTDSVSEHSRAKLQQVYDEVVSVAAISNKSSVGFSLLNRPELDRSYTKIHAWSLLEYSKIVFLDADIHVVKPIDELFEWDVPRGSIAAAPDIGWPDIFNSGVFVAVPDARDYEELIGRAVAGDSFDGGDQGLLNQYYTERGRWVRLPFTFNVTPSTSYQYAPAFRHFERQVSVVHFIGSNKPWDNAFHRHFHGQVAHSGTMDYVSKWWDVAYEHDDTKEMLKPPPQPLRPLTVETASSAAVQDFGSPPAAHHAATNADSAQDGKDALRFDAYGGYRDRQVDTIIRPDVRRWDATRMPPPVESKPEAANLPQFGQYANMWDEQQEHRPHHHRRHSGEKKHERKSSREPAHRTQKPLKPALKHTNYNPPSDLDDKTCLNLEIERKEHFKPAVPIGQHGGVPHDEVTKIHSPQFEDELATEPQGPPETSQGVSTTKDTLKNSSSSSKDKKDTSMPISKESAPQDAEEDSSIDDDGPVTPPFRFPILGPTVFAFPWETKDRPEPERVFPELEVPDAAAELPPPPAVKSDDEEEVGDESIQKELLERLEIAKQQVQDEEIWSGEAEKDPLVATEDEIFASSGDSVDPLSPAEALPEEPASRPKNAWDMIPNIDEYARFAAREHEYEDSDEEADTSVTPKPQKRNHFRGLSVSEEFSPQWRAKNTPDKS